MARPQHRPDREQKVIEKYRGRPLLLHLCLDWRFRIVFGLFVLGVLAVGLGIPKIWRTTPVGFEPVVKVSLLDMVQAKSLARSARALQATDKQDEAALTWAMAFANNLGDLTILRGLLRHEIERDDTRPGRDLSVLNKAHWAMRLSSTNALDADLTLQLYDQFQMYDMCAEFFRESDPATPSQKKVFLVTQLHRQNMDAFEEKWIAWKEVTNDPELLLCRAAVDAILPTEEASEARRRLGQATADPLHRVFAYRLQMWVGRRKFDVAYYLAALDSLQAGGWDTLQDHAGLWDLLIESERRSDAGARLVAHPNPPLNPHELLTFLSFYNRLGLQDELGKFLERHVDLFRTSRNMWFAYGDLLIKSRRWDDLESLVVRMRNTGRSTAEIPGYPSFLEGFADASRGYEARARTRFEETANERVSPPSFGLYLARNILAFGHADLSMRILESIRDPLANDGDFWRLFLSAARDLGDNGKMVAATGELYRLDPENPAHAGNLAAIWLINRTNLPSALSLTHKARRAWPNSPPLMINYALALVLNHRLEEAKSELDGLAAMKLTLGERAARDLVDAERLALSQEPDKARALLATINSEFLSPYQVQVVTRLQNQLAETPEVTH